MTITTASAPSENAATHRKSAGANSRCGTFAARAASPENAASITKAKDDDPITSKQIQRIYAIAGERGLTTPEAKQLIISLGYASTKDIKQKDYDSVCKAIEEAGKNG